MKSASNLFAALWCDALSLLVMLAVIYPRCTVVDFGNDAYSYLELSNHIFDDFYRIHVIRQFEQNTLYSSFCPPLYPLLIAAVRHISDVGMYAGMFLNIVICGLTLFALVRLTRPLGIPRWVGHIWFFLLLTTQDYMHEVASARTMPLAILLLVVLCDVLFRANLRKILWCCLIGLIAGLLVHARFDMIPAAAILGPVMWRLGGFKNFLPVAAYYLVLVLVLSPWVYYSEARFGKPFVSDNSRVATIVEMSHVANFYPEDQPPKTLRDDPARWTRVFVLRKARLVVDAVLGVLFNSFFLVLIGGMWVAMWLSGRLRAETLPVGGATGGTTATKGVAVSKPGTVSGAGPPTAAPAVAKTVPVDGSRGTPDVALRLRWFWVVLAAQVSTFALPGYAEARYFVPVVLYAAIYLARPVALALSWNAKPARYGVGIVTLLAFVTLVFTVQQLDVGEALAEPFHLQPRYIDPAQYNELTTALGPRGEESPRLLVLSGDVNPYQFSALTDYVSVYRPWNLRAETLPALVRQFQVTHILDPRHTLLGNGEDPLPVRPGGYEGLWEIVPTEPAEGSGEAAQ